MATYNWGVDWSFKADVDLNGYQYTFVKCASTEGYVTNQATAGASCVGVLQNDPRAGEEATVRILGFTKVKADCENSSSPPVFGGMIKCASNGMAQGMGTFTASTFAVGKSWTTLTSGSGIYITAEIFDMPVHL